MAGAGAHVAWLLRIWLGLTACAALVLAAPCAAAPKAAVTVHLGSAVVALDGPWRFATGDDTRWPDPAFDDSTWQVMDFSPDPRTASANGSGYAPGWGARGHRDYAGYGWYRMRVAASGAQPIALAGPTAVDGAYELYVDGQPVGGTGVFRGGVPVVHSAQPKLFLLPPNKTGVWLIALRVWTPWGLQHGEGGGFHVAPLIGNLDAVEAVVAAQREHYRRPYRLDAFEAAGFFILSLIAAGLIAARPQDRAYRWLVGGLLLLSCTRAAQLLFFWTQAESLTTYSIVRYVLLPPLVLGAWSFVWRWWLDRGGPRWLTPATAAAGGLYMAFALGGMAWFEPGSPVHALFGSAALAFKISLGAINLYALALGVWRRRDAACIAPCVVAAALGFVMFGDEFTGLGLKSSGVLFGWPATRTQIACAALIAALLVMVLERFVRLTREAEADVAAVAKALATNNGWGQPPVPLALAPRREASASAKSQLWPLVQRLDLRRLRLF